MYKTNVLTMKQNPRPVISWLSRMSILSFSLLSFHCTNELVFSSLVNNDVTLKVMGTYESNDPYGWFASLYTDDIIDGATPTTPFDLTGSDLKTTYQANFTPSSLKIFMDLAEIRVSTGTGKPSGDLPADYWEMFAQDRQLLCSDYNAEYGKVLTDCQKEDGIGKLNQFFNGGFTYPAVDVPQGLYRHIGVYFRRIVTQPAYQFNGTGTFIQENRTSFENRTIKGFDFANYYQFAPDASTSTEPLLFPLQRTDLEMAVLGDDERYVMEVRIFLKNVMMTHISQLNILSDASLSANILFASPSDWAFNHQWQSETNFNRLGGNVILAARVYKPSTVGSIKMTFGTACSQAYVAAVPAGTTYTTPVNKLPLVATRVGGSQVLENLPPGSYDVYITRDKQFCNATNCTNPTNDKDGFPETASLCAGGVTVAQGQQTTNAAVCACP